MSAFHKSEELDAEVPLWTPLLNGLHEVFYKQNDYFRIEAG
jgi:hypothetical protein